MSWLKDELDVLANLHELKDEFGKLDELMAEPDGVLRQRMSWVSWFSWRTSWVNLMSGRLSWILSC